MPKSRLVSLVGIVQAVSGISEGKLTIPEVADALSTVYDGDTMMIYEGGGYGLAPPVIGNPLDEHSGYKQRVDTVAEIYNSHFWDGSYAIHGRVKLSNYMVLSEDAVVIAQRLWRFFFPRQEREIDVAELVSAEQHGDAGTGTGAAELSDELDRARARISELERERAVLRKEVEATAETADATTINSPTLQRILEAVAAYPAWRTTQNQEPNLKAVLGWLQGDKKNPSRLEYVSHHVIAEHFGLKS